jgi:arylsulfatase A-like enzyme|tara:strand:+ start:2349 stop:4112 length:1764 start_codon:yes stop_codon:yes gene_type:complete
MIQEKQSMDYNGNFYQSLGSGISVFSLIIITNLLARRDTYLLRSSNKRLASAKRSEDGSVVRKNINNVPHRQLPDRHLSPRFTRPIGIRYADKRFDSRKEFNLLWLRLRRFRQSVVENSWLFLLNGRSLGSSLLISLILFPCLQAIAADSKPNVVLILSDDMGYSDLPKFGESEIPTPNIDRLANEGTLFTEAYVTAPVCVVSRMGLLSGQYQQRFGMYDNIYGEEKVRLFLDQTLLPSVFQKAGYRTALVGKWHLNGNKRKQYTRGSPLQRGFDEYISFLGGDSPFWKGTPVNRGDDPYPAPEYLTDLWGSEACAFIDRNQANPFFLYLAFNAVHSPMHALDADQDQFSNIEDENRRIYDGMLLSMDRSIGRVLQRLDTHGIADNTIVVFLNDNGGGESTERYAPHSRNFANNQPLQGHKFDVFEGGVRVPMMIRWPGQVPADSVYGKMVSSMDLLPTLVEAAGLPMPSDQPTDGVDLLPFIKGENTSTPHEWLSWQNRSWLPRKEGGFVVPTPNIHNSAIRKGNWKLVRLNENLDSGVRPPAWQLYNLETDIGERNDLADKHTDIVKELSSQFDSWRSSMHPTIE